MPAKRQSNLDDVFAKRSHIEEIIETFGFGASSTLSGPEPVMIAATTTPEPVISAFTSSGLVQQELKHLPNVIYIIHWNQHFNFRNQAI